MADTQTMFSVFILLLSQVAPWCYYATCKLRMSTLHSSTPTKFVVVSMNSYFINERYDMEGVYETFLSLLYTTMCRL